MSSETLLLGGRRTQAGFQICPPFPWGQRDLVLAFCCGGALGPAWEGPAEGCAFPGTAIESIQAEIRQPSSVPARGLGWCLSKLGSSTCALPWTWIVAIGAALLAFPVTHQWLHQAPRIPTDWDSFHSDWEGLAKLCACPVSRTVSAHWKGSAFPGTGIMCWVFPKLCGRQVTE